jgi:hypothetical protein
VEGKPIVTATEGESGVAEIQDADGFYTCERCGKVKSLASTCACGETRGEPVVPEGWDPEVTRGSRRLSIVPPEQSE